MPPVTTDLLNTTWLDGGKMTAAIE